ncbi:hypothetical protein [Streptomyces sp. NPDC058240]|uniref:hypothetical protein n=1 Tax=Streptomyces sp. NPDC058240 TaxID=3346396 RepID=UPI0036E692C9
MPVTETDEPAPESRSAIHPWRDLLQRWSDEWLDPVLHEQERHESFPDEVRAAHWLPGAVRYRSFWDLMNDEYRSFRGDQE